MCASSPRPNYSIFGNLTAKIIPARCPFSKVAKGAELPHPSLFQLPVPNDDDYGQIVLLFSLLIIFLSELVKELEGCDRTWIVKIQLNIFKELDESL